jgi:imidazolonepropionase-like amidohydrolase
VLQGRRIDAPRVLLTGAALADGLSPELRRGVSILIDDDVIAGIWPDGAEELDHRVVERIDASGATVVPAMVDSHSHVSMQGGAQWIARGADPTETLLAVAEENGELLVRSGVRWIRDVGAPRRDGKALTLRIREQWAGRRDRPYLRAAGTWLTAPTILPPDLAVECAGGAELLAAALGQLDDGADLVKLYLDGPDRETSPFTLDEVRAVVRDVHARGARVAAHASQLAGARVAAEAGVDSIEHGFALDAGIAKTMAAGGVTLVSTLAVLHSFQTFTGTSTVPRFTDEAIAASLAGRLELAEESVRLAHAAGVAIAAGSDFGGGSLRAGMLAWEVQSLVRAGVPPWEALAAATWRGGDLLGDPQAGRLTVGGPAHLLLVHGNPLTDPDALWRVWLTR